MKINRLFFALVASSIIFVSCSEEDAKPKGKYESGVIIANEGGFGKGNATVTFFNPSTDETESSIFQKAGSTFAGDVLQSITFKDDRGYLVLNGSNKIEVVNGHTFEAITTLQNEAIVSPRYVAVINNKAYISVWGPYNDNWALVDSYVLVMDLTTNTVVKKIDTHEGTENLLVYNNKLFAANYNYGSSRTVAVINPADNSLTSQIEVGAGPAGMVIDKNEKLWVLCTGSYVSGTAKLVRINPSTLAIEKEIGLDILPDADLALSADRSNLIYRDGKAVYKMSIDATDAPENPLFKDATIATPYALAVDPSTGEIWIADAKDYASEGSANVYSPAGVLTTTITTGINPGQFIFKK